MLKVLLGPLFDFSIFTEMNITSGITAPCISDIHGLSVNLSCMLILQDNNGIWPKPTSIHNNIINTKLTRQLHYQPRNRPLSVHYMCCEPNNCKKMVMENSDRIQYYYDCSWSPCIAQNIYLQIFWYTLVHYCSWQLKCCVCFLLKRQRRKGLTDRCRGGEEQYSTTKTRSNKADDNRPHFITPCAACVYKVAFVSMLPLHWFS